MYPWELVNTPFFQKSGLFFFALYCTVYHCKEIHNCKEIHHWKTIILNIPPPKAKVFSHMGYVNHPPFQKLNPFDLSAVFTDIALHLLAAGHTLTHSCSHTPECRPFSHLVSLALEKSQRAVRARRVDFSHDTRAHRKNVCPCASPVTLVSVA